MPTTYTLARALVIIVPLLAMVWLAYRKFWPRDPVRVAAKRLRAIGFHERFAPDWDGGVSYDGISFERSRSGESCPGCGERAFILYKWSREKDETGYPREYLTTFGTACPHCSHLEKLSANMVPERLRDAWKQAADLDDFLARAA